MRWFAPPRSSASQVAFAADPAPVPAGSPIPVPEWLYPIDPKSLEKNPKPVKLDDVELLEIPESKEKFTQARINNPFNAPDWRPNDHLPMPDVVARGRKPDIMACAYCHTPTGQGRPGEFRAGGPARGLYKGATARLSQRARASIPAPSNTCRACRW